MHKDWQAGESEQTAVFCPFACLRFLLLPGGYYAISEQCDGLAQKRLPMYSLPHPAICSELLHPEAITVQWVSIAVVSVGQFE